MLHSLKHMMSCTKPKDGLTGSRKDMADVMAVVDIASGGDKGKARQSESKRLWHKKRAAVTADTTVSAAVTVFPKSSDVKELLTSSISRNLLFQDMPLAALELIVDSMFAMDVPPNTDVVKQGDKNATQFYVVECGSCDVWLKGPKESHPKKVLTCTRGSCFGDLALLFNAPRAATVRSSAPCRLWVMERAVYNAVKRNFTHEQFSARHKLLDTVPALKHLSAHHRALLVDALTQVEFKAGSYVFRKGDPGTDFYIVNEGTALIKDGAQVLSRYVPGQFFGERALLGGETRAADVQAEGRLVCFCLTQAHFQSLLGTQEEIWRFEHLKEVPVLAALSDRQLWQVAQAMGSQSYTKGEVVFRKGDQGDMFYIVHNGAFTVFDEAGKELARVAEGSCFGELALLRRDVRAATVMALTDASCLTLSREQFDTLLGNLTQLRHVWRLETLRKVPLFVSIDAKTRGAIAAAMGVRTHKTGEHVIKQGEQGSEFYVVERGELGVFKDEKGPLKTYGPGTYFGELALLTNEARAASVRATSDVSLLVLDRDQFRQLMGPLLPALQKEAASYMTGEKKKAIKVKQAEAKAVLGAGGFGQVLLVEYLGQHNALKCMSKAFVKEQGLVEHVKREKEFMAECESPFTVQLIGTDQDPYTLYIMLEAVMGGELFSYLQTRSAPLSESHARFYAASVVLAFEYMHDRQLVYRDLKPENLLIDLKGYVKLTDFGFVKRVKKGQKTFTLCGTPEYLAPEIIMNKGHNAAADWWALGVLIFELCHGLPPFMDEDRLIMFKKICNRQLTFPKHFSQPLRSLIDRLLDPNPVFRAGAGRQGVAEVKQHAWFQGFDWDAFEARRLAPPYLPRQPKHPTDLVNFNPMQLDQKAFRSTKYVSRGDFADF